MKMNLIIQSRCYLINIWNICRTNKNIDTDNEKPEGYVCKRNNKQIFSGILEYSWRKNN